MFDLLDTLRAKPVYVRQHIAFGVTAVITLIIGVIWWSTVDLRGTTQAEKTLATKTPVDVLSDLIVNSKQMASQTIDDLMGIAQYESSVGDQVAGVGATGTTTGGVI